MLETELLEEILLKLVDIKHLCCIIFFALIVGFIIRKRR